MDRLVPSSIPLLATVHNLMAFAWFACVSDNIRSPYLDEFFHVRQALAYYETNDFRVWDPKITTPPGLYLVSYLGLQVARLFPNHHLSSPLDLLRMHSTIGIAGCFMVLLSLVSLRNRRDDRDVVGKFANSLTAFNMGLFPPLFFFSALYYTDVLSVLVVLLAHHAFAKRRPVMVAVYSLASLWFRQTNVFWTAVYLGGSEVVRVLNTQQGRPRGKTLQQGADWMDVVRVSWTNGSFYDPPVESAYLEDYIKMALSLGLSSLRNIQFLILPLIPHLITLGAFGVFILWNGGVVLGDKDNHIASIHLPQMLYIWAYMIFFSWPTILHSLLRNTLSSLPRSITSHLPQFLIPTPPTHKPTPRLIILIPALILTLLTIHFNTIIHPFTLADNRHYTFYVFKFFRQYPLVKYLLAPVYIFFAWACISALASSSSSTTNNDNPTSDNTTANATTTIKIKSSTLLLWLLTCTLSLATAPLVEPRYFILPWIVWRLNVSSSSSAPSSSSITHNNQQQQNREETNSSSTSLSSSSLTLLLPLIVESLWYILINGLTCWVFIKKGFSWDSSPDEIMRFMW